MKFNCKKMFTTFLAVSLILDGYAFKFAPSISLSYIFLLFFLFVFLINIKKDSPKINLVSLLMIFTLILISVFYTFFDNLNIITNKFILDSFKMIAWGLTLSFVPYYLDYGSFIKKCTKISLYSTAYLFIQAILFYILSIKLPNGIDFPFIKYIGVDISSFVSTYRPASIFSEPSYYSMFVLLTLAMNLFREKETPNVFFIVILCIGIIISTSTGGIYLLLILFILKFIFNSKKITKKSILILLLAVPSLLFIINNYESLLSRLGSVGEATLKALDKVSNYESSSRLGGSYQYISLLKGKNFILGYGIGNEYAVTGGQIRYFNSITRLFLQTGLIGIIIFSLYCLYNVAKSRGNVGAFYIMIFYIVKVLTAGSMFSISGLLILSIYYKMFEKKRNG